MKTWYVENYLIGAIDCRADSDTENKDEVECRCGLKTWKYVDNSGDTSSGTVEIADPLLQQSAILTGQDVIVLHCK